MTPMIDVVFLLLIFLLCAANDQIQESLLPTDLAAGAIESTTVETPPKPLGEVWLYLRTDADNTTAIQVNEGGRIYRDFAELERQLNQLAAAAPEIPVILDIQPTVPLGDMIHVYDTARAAGFNSINFAIDRPEPRQPKK